VLICVYRFQDAELNFIKETEIPGIFHVTNGFWVNEEYEYTPLIDSKYWIPVSQILQIRKQ